MEHPKILHPPDIEKVSNIAKETGAEVLRVARCAIQARLAAGSWTAEEILSAVSASGVSKRCR